MALLSSPNTIWMIRPFKQKLTFDVLIANISEIIQNISKETKSLGVAFSNVFNLLLVLKKRQSCTRFVTDFDLQSGMIIFESRLITCDHLWPLVTTCDHLWPLVTTCDHLWPLLTTFDHFWSECAYRTVKVIDSSRKKHYNLVKLFQIRDTHCSISVKYSIVISCLFCKVGKNVFKFSTKTSFVASNSCTNFNKEWILISNPINLLGLRVCYI